MATPKPEPVPIDAWETLPVLPDLTVEVASYSKEILDGILASLGIPKHVFMGTPEPTPLELAPAADRPWLVAICENLQDPDLKLIWADCLEEQGDPRAYALRWMVRRERLPAKEWRNWGKLFKGAWGWFSAEVQPSETRWRPRPSEATITAADVFADPFTSARLPSALLEATRERGRQQPRALGLSLEGAILRFLDGWLDCPKIAVRNGCCTCPEGGTCQAQKGNGVLWSEDFARLEPVGLNFIMERCRTASLEKDKFIAVE